MHGSRDRRDEGASAVHARERRVFREMQGWLDGMNSQATIAVEFLFCFKIATASQLEHFLLRSVQRYFSK